MARDYVLQGFFAVFLRICRQQSGTAACSRFKVQAMWACVWVGVDSYLSPVCVFMIYLQN